MYHIIILSQRVWRECRSYLNISFQINHYISSHSIGVCLFILSARLQDDTALQHSGACLGETPNQTACMWQTATRNAPAGLNSAAKTLEPPLKCSLSVGLRPRDDSFGPQLPRQ